MSTKRIYWFNSDGVILTNILREFEKTEKINVLDLYNQYLESNRNKQQSNKVKKKIDIMRENNLKVIKKKEEEREMVKYDMIMNDQEIFDLGIENINKLNTMKYKVLFKFELLKKLVKDKDDDNFTEILDLYLQLYSIADNDINKKLIRKITRNFVKKEIPYKFYALKNLSDRLPPLDFYNNSKPTLDDWQIEIIDYINNNQSVIVQAPTSSGKTWVSIYSVVRNKQKNNDKITLYIVPSKPLALQVAGLFRKILGCCVSILYDDRSYYSSNTKVIVATIQEAETHIYKFYNKIDFVIIDEVHNLNEKNLGEPLERLIKLFSHCNFLALSATISNPNELYNWWSTINKNKINLITYKRRFINLQRCHFNFEKSKIENLHPMDCLEIKDLINNEFNIPFTPYDIAILYEKIENLFEYDDICHLDPDEIIKNERPSLDDTKEYENVLKKGLYDLNSKFPKKIKKLIESFNKKPSVSDKDVDLSSFVQQLKEKDLLPAILFNYSSSVCNKMYLDLVRGIISKEKLFYPYHYDNLQYKKSLIGDYFKMLKKFEMSEKQAQSNCKKRIDKINILAEKEEKVRNFNNIQLGIYINKLSLRYKQQCKDINDIENHNLKELQLKNLTKEYKKDIKVGSVPMYIDIFQKHKSFCFTNDNPMSEDEIRDIRRELKKALSNGDKVSISYENIFIQGLKYGVGLYTTNINEIYKLIVQRLCQNNKLNIVIADKELSQGVNLPFRLSALVGYAGHRDFDPIFVQQASGRAGRRGKDKKGYQCFINVNWNSIMKGKLTNLCGFKEDSTVSSYPLLKHLNSDIDYNSICDNMLYLSDKDCRHIKEPKQITVTEEQEKFLPLAWKIRKFGWDKIKSYLEYLEYSVISITGKSSEQEFKVINKINELFISSDNLEKKYREKIEFIPEMKVLGDILKYTYNQLEYESEFKLLRSMMKNIFDNLLQIQYRSSNLK